VAMLGAVLIVWFSFSTEPESGRANSAAGFSP